MSDSTKIENQVFSASLEEEMRSSYLEYAMSVIVGRALPDVRDGLKPVHRRVLYAMSELGNTYNSSYKKSARIVGDVIGKYHPHGDTAVYDAAVRMAQPFSMRYMLIDGQGNFGSVDGDSPAAMRYTEVRMAQISQELLMDLDKGTVDFMANYDESEHEPVVLPTRIPNLLINGSNGIAVGMATNIPPHNLREVVDAVLALSKNGDITVDELLTYMPGPDFPTAGIINGAAGIKEAYITGKGRIHVRAKVHYEEVSADKQSIIVTELPYAVNKARLIEKMAELVKEKRIESISALRDESDKQGMRMVIELKRGEVPEVVLNQLYKMTALQTVFGINMVALVDGQPKLLSLKEILEAFLEHRSEVVTRRSLFELAKARARAHILEGLAIALANIEEMIEVIRRSSTPLKAREELLTRKWEAGLIQQLIEVDNFNQSKPEDMPEDCGITENGKYQLSEVQAQAILDLRLHRLTGLEQEKIHDEFKELLDIIANLLEILRNPQYLLQVIQEELEHVRERYGDERRTVINNAFQDLTIEDLIPQEERVVTLSFMGYIKTQPLAEYQAQRRGGKGRMATATKEEDFLSQMFVASSHATLLCFSSKGKVYWKKVYEMPVGSRQARGKPVANLLPLEKGETITTVLPVEEYAPDKFVLMATKSGVVKKTSLLDFSRPRANGIIALTLKDDDAMIGALLTDGNQDVMLFSSEGKAARFSEDQVRNMGRLARGVIGMRTGKEGSIISMMIADKEGSVLTATVNGYGKRTPVEDYPCKGRGGKGVISIKTNDRNGKVASAVMVNDDDDVMLISDGGTIVRIAVAEINQASRNTMGVRLIRLVKKECLLRVARVEASEDEDDLEQSGEDNAQDVIPTDDT